MMKRYNKYLILILVLISIFIITGCNSFSIDTFKNPDEYDNKTDNNISPSPTNKPDVNDIDKPIDIGLLSNLENDEPTPTIIQPIENTQLLIYIVNSSTDLEAVTALIPADYEITPELIVDTLVNSMADQSLIIGIESVTTKDDSVIVSFYADQPPLANVGSGLEYAILNAIAQSLTDNLDDYNKVIYRVEGGQYISGHIELGLDEVYHEDP